MFAVNNLDKDDTDFQKIRSALQQAVERCEEFTVQCPSTWLIFSLVLRAKHKSSQILTYQDCFTIAQNCGISDRAELNNALVFIHSRLGLLRYFCVEELNGLVVIDPQILFDTITKLIVETFTSDYAKVNEIEEFQKRGILSMKVMERISNKRHSDPQLPFKWLLNLLNHLRIAAFFIDRNGERKCFFPSVLCHAPLELKLYQSINLSIKLPPHLLIAFKGGFCPRGIPSALIKYLMTNEMKSEITWELHSSRVFRNQVSFGVGPCDIILKILPTHLEISIDPESDIEDDSDVMLTCTEAFIQFQQAMAAITVGYRECDYFFAFYCTKPKCQAHPHPAEIELGIKKLRCRITERRGPLPQNYDLWMCQNVPQTGDKTFLHTRLDSVLDSDHGGVPKHLGQITDCMTEWEGRIADEFGLTLADVASIKSKYPSNLELQKRAALEKWKQKLGSSATYNNLIDVFERAGYQDYADAVRKLVQPKISHEMEHSSKLNLIAPQLSQEPVFPELPESSRVATATATAVLIKEKDNEGHYGQETVHVKAEKVLEDNISKSITTSTSEQHSTTHQQRIDGTESADGQTSVPSHSDLLPEDEVPRNSDEAESKSKNIKESYNTASAMSHPLEVDQHCNIHRHSTLSDLEKQPHSNVKKDEKNKAATLKYSHEETEKKSNLRRAITSSVKRIKGLFKKQGDKAQVTSELATEQEEDLPSMETIAASLDHNDDSALKQQDETLPIYIALHDYDARTSEDLSFQKGENLHIAGSLESDWLHARSLMTEREGYIPRSYVAPVSTIQAKDWYFGSISRTDAEKLLQESSLESGTYLIRGSENTPGDFSLSLRDNDRIRHYRIRRLDNGSSYFVTRRVIFPTLDELVEYYSQQADGLCHTLTAICPRVPPSVISLSYKDECEIEKQSITLKKKIGEGDFGCIWEGLWNQSAPIIVEAYGESSLDVQKLRDKLQSLKKIQHQNVLQFYAASIVTESSVREPLYFIFEFINNASILLDYLRSDRGHQLKLPQMIDIGAQIASGMAYLEAQNYVHGDLAARSVLINDIETVKTVARIKLALHRNEETTTKIKWLAPEAALHNRFSIKSDIWSFGMLLTELVTYGQQPYPDMTNSQVISKLQMGYRIPCPQGCPDHLYEIMLDCWKADPTNRPTFPLLEFLLGEYFVISEKGYREPDKAI